MAPAAQSHVLGRDKRRSCTNERFTRLTNAVAWRHEPICELAETRRTYRSVVSNAADPEPVVKEVPDGDANSSL